MALEAVALFQKHEPGPRQFGAVGRPLIKRPGARCQMIAVVEQMQGLKPARIKGLGEQHKVKPAGVQSLEQLLRHRLAQIEAKLRKSAADDRQRFRNEKRTDCRDRAETEIALFRVGP